jgi:hypothetical protein
MSCALTAGYALGCRNSVGGVYSLSLANFNPTGSVTTNGSGTVTWLNGYGLENLLSYSQQLDVSGNGTNNWQVVSASVSANTTTAPDGTVTADTVTFSGSPVESYIRQFENLTTGTTYTYSAFIKNNTFNSASKYFLFAVYANASAEISYRIYPELADSISNFTYTSGTIAATPTYKRENYGNDWYRYSLTFTTASNFPTGTTSLFLYATSASLAATNNAISVWGVQLERGSYAGYYVPTVATSSYVGYPFFKYELPRNTASIVQTKQASTENGTLFYQQDLNFVENKLSIGLRNEFRRLAETKSIAIVVDRNGNKWILGSDTGLELTAGNAQTGINQGDRNGYDITLTGLESYPMMAVQEVLATPANEGIEGYLPDGQRTQSSGNGTPGAAPFVPTPG